MDDVRAVMDAAGSERAVLLGLSEGGPLSVVFAATNPGRTMGLILVAPDLPGGVGSRVPLNHALGGPKD
jgi:pimeloyl-ACP methyl ester carboxylesterase